MSLHVVEITAIAAMLSGLGGYLYAIAFLMLTP